MDCIDERVANLEGQVNAMAQAWLYLAQVVETQGGMDLVAMEYDLRRQHWPKDQEIDEGARAVMGWLCDQLDTARERRQALARRSDGRRQSKGVDVDAFDNVVSITRARPISSQFGRRRPN